MPHIVSNANEKFQIEIEIFLVLLMWLTVAVEIDVLDQSTAREWLKSFDI